LHDPGRLLLEKRSPEGRVTTYTYNDHHQLIVQADAKGKTTLAYDAEGRLISRTDALGQRRRYAYDPQGQLSKVIEANQVWTYTYDPQGRLIEQKAPNGALTKTVYNAQGLPATLTNALGQTRTLFWDEHQRLVGSLDIDGVRIRYAYDEDDRIVEAVTQDGRPGIATMPSVD
jgi:YD repeat-containing protein